MGRQIAATAARTLKRASPASSQHRHLVDDELGVVLLADAVAWPSASERAAALAVNAAFAQLALALHRGPVDLAVASSALADALRFARAAVEQAKRRDEALRNTTSSLVGAVFVGGHVVIGRLGDLRAYRLRHAFLKQVTTVDDAQVPTPPVQLLTRAIGNPLSAEPDVHVEAVADDDVLLFCSNGLSDVLERHTTAEILLGSDNLEMACERLVEAASGAVDNTIVVVVRPAPREGA